MRDHPYGTKDHGDRISAAPVEVKFAPSDTGDIAGYGSVYGITDMHGDVVEGGAFDESIKHHRAEGTRPLMLWGHNPDRVIGAWETFSSDAYGLKLSGKLNLETQDGREALSLLKQGALSGLSIGYQVAPGGAEIDRKGIRHLKKLMLWEVSIVGIPSNDKARISGVKSIASLRDFEGFLHESGFAKAAARNLAGGGWPALSRQNEQAATEILDAVKQATMELTKGRKP